MQGEKDFSIARCLRSAPEEVATNPVLVLARSSIDPSCLAFASVALAQGITVRAVDLEWLCTIKAPISSSPR